MTVSGWNITNRQVPHELSYSAHPWLTLWDTCTDAGQQGASLMVTEPDRALSFLLFLLLCSGVAVRARRGVHNCHPARKRHLCRASGA